MNHRSTTIDEQTIWADFNRLVFAAAAAHLPHDVDAYERARAIAQRNAERQLDAIREQTREEQREKMERARRWRQPSALVPFDSELS